MSFVKYTNPHRREFDANQSESSTLTLYADKASFNGYQAYSLLKDGNVVFHGGKQNAQWRLLSTLSISGESFADLGCSNGALGFAMARHFGFNRVYFLDHDTECVTNLHKCKEWFGSFPFDLQIEKFTFGSDTLKSYDILMTLSTIHWFYSATAAYGCLLAILQELANHTNRALIIEWVDPSDPAIRSLKHISFNSSIHKTPYSKENFLEGLSRSFTSFTKVGNTTATRELYIAYK